MKIADQIILKRKELNLTQKDLAKKLDVTDKTVSRWERGTTIPDVHMLKKISLVIGLDLNVIFNEMEVKINEDEPIDLESIKRYRIGFISTALLFIFAATFFFIINLTSHSNFDTTSKVLFPVFFTLAILMIMGGLVIYVVSFIKFHSSFSSKEYKRRYTREISKSVVILLAAIIVIIISLSI